jgi:hypothetical protein
MSELEIFLLTGVLIPNFNTVDLVKKFEKNQKLHIHIVWVEGYVKKKKKSEKKKKKQYFIGKKNIFFKNYPLGPF